LAERSLQILGKSSALAHGKSLRARTESHLARNTSISTVSQQLRRGLLLANQPGPEVVPGSRGIPRRAATRQRRLSEWQAHQSKPAAPFPSPAEGLAGEPAVPHGPPAWAQAVPAAGPPACMTGRLWAGMCVGMTAARMALIRAVASLAGLDQAPARTADAHYLA
jgi:hypothetical protein